MNTLKSLAYRWVQEYFILWVMFEESAQTYRISQAFVSVNNVYKQRYTALLQVFIQNCVQQVRLALARRVNQLDSTSEEFVLQSHLHGRVQCIFVLSVLITDYYKFYRNSSPCWRLSANLYAIRSEKNGIWLIGIFDPNDSRRAWIFVHG